MASDGARARRTLRRFGRRAPRTCWDELLEPCGEGEDGEESKWLEEHEKVENEEPDREAEVDEGAGDAAVGAEGVAHVGQHAEVDDTELGDEEEERLDRPRVVARLPEQLDDGDVGGDVGKEHEDGDEAVG